MPGKVVPFSPKTPLAAPPSHKLLSTVKRALTRARDPLHRTPLSTGPRVAWDGAFACDSPLARPANAITIKVASAEPAARSAAKTSAPSATPRLAAAAAADDDDDDLEVLQLVEELGLDGSFWSKRRAATPAKTKTPARKAQTPAQKPQTPAKDINEPIPGKRREPPPPPPAAAVADITPCDTADDTDDEADESLVPTRLFPAQDENAEPNSVLLHTAVAQGNLSLMARVLQMGFVVDSPDSGGRSALMYAVHYEQVDCVKALLARGANVNHQAADGSTALHYAAFSGSLAMQQLLLKHQADPLLADHEQRTAVHWSAHNPAATHMHELLKLGHGRGAQQLNLRDGAGMTPAMWAAYYNHPAHLRGLIKLGADLQAQDVEGKTVLHWAVHSGRAEPRCLRLLLTHDASSWADQLGRTVAHAAAEAGNAKALERIFKLRPSAVNDKDANGRSPLHWAAVHAHVPAVRTLLRHGADPLAADLLGLSPYHYAHSKGARHCCVLLQAASQEGDQPSDATPLPELAPVADPTLEEAHRVFGLLTAGTRLKKFTENGTGALHERYFWLDAETAQLKWAKTLHATSCHSAVVVDVVEGPCDAVCARSDFQPTTTHLLAFSLILEDNAHPAIHLVAPDSDQYHLWVSGIRHLQAYSGLVHALQDQRQRAQTGCADVQQQEEKKEEEEEGEEGEQGETGEGEGGDIHGGEQQ